MYADTHTWACIHGYIDTWLFVYKSRACSMPSSHNNDVSIQIKLHARIHKTLVCITCSVPSLLTEIAACIHTYIHGWVHTYIHKSSMMYHLQSSITAHWDDCMHTYTTGMYVYVFASLHTSLHTYQDESTRTYTQVVCITCSVPSPLTEITAQYRRMSMLATIYVFMFLCMYV